MTRKTPREIVFSSKFKRDLKKHYTELVSLAWSEVFHCLLNDINLPEKYRDHALVGDLKGCRDCHIKPDLVLIYEKADKDTLVLIRLGTHSQLARLGTHSQLAIA